MPDVIQIGNEWATLDEVGIWQCDNNPDLAERLNFECGVHIVGGDDPDPTRTIMNCAVEKFGATIVHQDEPEPDSGIDANGRAIIY